MTLVSNIVRSSLLLLDAIDAAGAVPAQDFQDAVLSLNRLCTRWEANGLALGWSNVAAPDDVMPSPDEAELAIIYNLAVLLPGYARPADFGLVINQAKTYLAELQRDRIVEMPLRSRSDLPTPEQGGVWNMYTDRPNVR
jgi:hypothetical protein